LTAFRISQETRERLKFYGVVVGWAIQPTWLRWDYIKQATSPIKHDSPWEIAIFADVPFPTLNGQELAHGFGATPEEAIERALSHPSIRYGQSGLSRALWLLDAEINNLTYALRAQRFKIERPPSDRPAYHYTDDLDDDIPF
jgi:hypothetical protein